jgi:glycosyltransferase involved in cell wall biosynthesis
MNFYYSVIIPFYGDIAILEKVLCSLEMTQYQNKEIILVNDGTNYDFAAIKAKYNPTLVNLSERHGPSFARNAGARAANFEYLAFLDSDVMVPRDCFNKINGFLENDRSISVLNCLLSSSCPYDDFFSQHTNMIFRYAISKNGHNTVYTHFCIVNTKSFWQVEGFDEHVPLQRSDDLVLGWRFADKGHKLALIEGLRLTHHKRMTLSKFISWNFSHGYAYGKFYRIYRRRLESLKYRVNDKGVIFLLAIIIFVTPLIYLKTISIMAGLLICLSAFLTIHFGLLNFLFKEKGSLFVFKSIWLIILRYITYAPAAMAGMISGSFESNGHHESSLKND